MHTQIHIHTYTRGYKQQHIDTLIHTHKHIQKQRIRSYVNNK